MKRILQLAVLCAAVVAQPALAEKVSVCHKNKKTISISARALPAHLAHGDAEGTCPVIEPPAPVPFAVVVLRCDSAAGAVSVVSSSASDAEEPVLLPLPGDNCASAVAGFLNGGWELEFVTSGPAVTPAEGESGFVTEYTFIADGEDDEDDDDD